MDGAMSKTGKVWTHEDMRRLPPAHQQRELFRKPEDMKGIISEAEKYWQDQFDIVAEDRRMYGGEQWIANDEEERAGDGRPAPVINEIAAFADFMHGVIDSEQMTVSVMERDLPGENTSGSAQFTGLETQEKFSRSAVLAGHLRHLLEDSDFPAHRSDATHKVLTEGIAYLRLYTDYDEGDPNNLTFRLSSIHEPLDVLFDPSFTQPDAADASWCAVQSRVHVKEAKRRWPNSNVDKHGQGNSIFPSHSISDRFWVDDADRVRVVEFFQLVEEKELRIFLTDGTDIAKHDYDKVVDELQERGVAPVGAREFCKNRVYMSRWVGDELITGPTLLPYDRLPIFPIFGRRKHYNNKVCYYSVIHEATDPQRMENYTAAQLMIGASRSGNAPWVATPEAVGPYLKDYADPMNQKNVIFYQGQDSRGRPQPAPTRQQPLSADPVVLQALQFASAKLSDIIGIDDAGMGRHSNALSARSSEVRIAAQQQNMTQFIGSISRAIERACEAIVYAIPDVYDNERYVRVRMKDGESDWVLINPDLVVDEETGEAVPINSLATKNRLLVRIKAAPSDTTKRQAVMREMVELAKINKDLVPLLADRIARYSDSPLADEIGDRLLVALPPTALSREERERRVQAEVDAAKMEAEIELRVAMEVQQPLSQARQQLGLPEPQPSPEVQLQMEKTRTERARGEKEIGQTQAQAQLRDAKLAQTQAETQGGVAKDAAKLAGQQMANRKAQAEEDGNQQERIQDLVNEAVLRALTQLGFVPPNKETDNG